MQPGLPRCTARHRADIRAVAASRVVGRFVWLAALAAAPCTACTDDDATVAATAQPDAEDEPRRADATLTEPDAPREPGRPQESEPVCPGGADCPCASAAECDIGFCFDGPDGQLCARPCSTGCPPDWTCAAAAAGDDVVKVCVLHQGGLSARAGAGSGL